MQRIVTLVAILIAISATVFSADIEVSIDTDFAEPGETIYLRLLLNTDTPIASLRVPITMESPWITLEEVSWENAIARRPEFLDSTHLSNDNRTDAINILPWAFVSPLPTIDLPGGEICRFWITIDPEAPEGFIPVDTYEDQFSWVDASDGLGTSYVGEFYAGGIWVQENSAAADDDLLALPAELLLGQNRPNPFNPTTTIDFSLARATEIELSVYDILGRKIAVLANGSYPAGQHQAVWTAAGAASGVYFYRLRAGETTLTRKMILLK